MATGGFLGTICVSGVWSGVIVVPGIVSYRMERIVSILPQAIAALIIAVLLGLGAFFIGSNGGRASSDWQPATICTTGTTPVQCVGN